MNDGYLLILCHNILRPSGKLKQNCTFLFKFPRWSILLDYHIKLNACRLPPFFPGLRILKTNRGHWSIENSCHYIIDWNYDEDRGRIRTGHGPENITRLRRFAVGIMKSKRVTNVAQKIRQLQRNTRLVLDYLCMTENSRASVGSIA